jgi:hypothetical protein
MRLAVYIKKFREFLSHERLHKQWLKDLAKESHSKAFTKELKRKVKDRDGWKCQECGIKARQLRQMGSYLTVHHIDFNHENCKMSNLITLCPLCHCKTNFQKSSWVKYYSEKIELVYEKKESAQEEKQKIVEEKLKAKEKKKCSKR